MDCARTLMMEKGVSQKYWREVISIVVYTLNRVQVKKGTNATSFELWYDYAPNVKYFKIFGRKCYILKDNRNGKLDAKSDKGIFLGYSTKSKAYKSLYSKTNKVVESANVKVDEFAERNDVECKKEPKYYSTFIYVDDGAPNTPIKQENKATFFQHIGNTEVQQHIVEQQTMDVEE